MTHKTQKMRQGFGSSALLHYLCKCPVAAQHARRRMPHTAAGAAATQRYAAVAWGGTAWTAAP